MATTSFADQEGMKRRETDDAMDIDDATATRGLSGEDGSTGDAATATTTATTDDDASREVPKEVPGETLPMRVLDEYEFRDKFDENKAVSVHGSKPSRVLAIGKARKLTDGEHGLPSVVLASELVPQDRPPHALKLMDVRDWTIRYGGEEPEIWLVTQRAWYKLLQPSARFEKYVTVTLRRARFTNALVRALAADWNLSLEDGLALILSVPVVPHDVPMAVKTPNKAAKLIGNTTPEEQKETALCGKTEEEAKDTGEYKYTHADIVGDGFFIASQLESMVYSKALRPPGVSVDEEATAPALLVDLQNWTREKHQLGTMTKASRLERDRARRERIRAEKAAEIAEAKKPPPVRLEAPPPASPILPEYSSVGPRLQAEVLTLWDFAQVFAQVLHIPRCPLERYAKAFFSDDVSAAEAALLRDFMVACLRLTEGRTDSVDAENAKKPPKSARWWTSPILGLNDVGELDWQDRANNVIQDYQYGINARVRAEALRAVEKLEKETPVEKLSPENRVALAVALCAVAMESDLFREYFTEIYEGTRSKRKTGEFHFAPPNPASEVPKKESDDKNEKVKEERGDDAMEVDGGGVDEKNETDVKEENEEAQDGDANMEDEENDDDEEEEEKPPTLREYRREQYTKWRDEAVERAIIHRGKPYAVDLQGRRYFMLGGLNNGGRLYVETAPEGWLVEDDSPPEIVDGVERPKQPIAGPPVEDAAFTKELADVAELSENVSGLVEYASRWGVYEPGPELDALSKWCNAKCESERFIMKLNKLLAQSVEEDADERDDAEDGAEPKLDDETRRGRIQELCSSSGEDGYANLDGIPSESVNEKELVSRLFSVVKHILHACPWWRTGDQHWMDRFLKVSNLLDSAAQAQSQSLVDLLMLLPAVEGVCDAAGLMDNTLWAEAKPTWLAQIRFYVLGPRSEAELNGTAPLPQVDDSIPAIHDILLAPELVEPLQALNTRRAANLVNQFLRCLAQDPNRMSQGGFQLCTGVAHGAAGIQTGETVALIKRGLAKTYARYIDRKSRPKSWIDVSTLRPTERCVVLGTAYRAGEVFSVRGRDDERLPPCAWMMLLLIDPPDVARPMASRNRAAPQEEEEKKHERRLVIAPLYAGGDIADYVLPWNKYQDAQNDPWNVGDRIMMQFEGVETADESKGLIELDNGLYYLGRVRSVRRSTPDNWETVMIVFDSDPDDYMWVSPWEIVAAPEKYHDPVHEAPAPVDPEKLLSPEDLALVARCKSVARHLGWPAGDNKREFDKYHKESFGGVPPQPPIFCRTPLNVHRVFLEAMHLGGYESVTRNKLWKTVARTLGRDLTSQTSASFALRKAYEKCLYPLEKLLTTDEMAKQLGLVADGATMADYPGTNASQYVGYDDDDMDNDAGRARDSDNDDDEDADDDDVDIDEKEDAKDAPDKDDESDFKISDDDFDEPSDDDSDDSDY